jgi:hypothetical protein
MLIAAIGLILVDNCNFSLAMAALGSQRTGGLSLAPLRIDGATGCTVNPQLIL